MTPTPIREERCDRCGEALDVQPGETFVGSTDGRVWHYGCRPPARPAMTTREDEMVALIERLRAHASAWGDDNEGRDFTNAADALTALSSERDLLRELLRETKAVVTAEPFYASCTVSAIR